MSISFKLHDLQSAPEASKATLESVQRSFGFLPNLMRTFAESPVALQSYLAVSALFDKSDFTPAERQVILLAVSSANQCEYCVAVHSTIAKNMVKVEPAIVDGLRTRASLSDAKLDALAKFTQLMVKERGYANEAGLQAFLDAGYTKRHALEVIVAIGLKTISNYTNHLTHTPLDTQFQGEKWESRK